MGRNAASHLIITLYQPQHRTSHPPPAPPQSPHPHHAIGVNPWPLHYMVRERIRRANLLGLHTRFCPSLSTLRLPKRVASTGCRIVVSLGFSFLHQSDGNGPLKAAHCCSKYCLSPLQMNECLLFERKWHISPNNVLLSTGAFCIAHLKTICDVFALARFF